MVCRSVNCADVTPSTLEPYGDISGPGVIIGFLGSGLFTLLLITGYYFTGFKPRGPSASAQGEEKLNPADVIVLGAFSRKSRSPGRRWRDRLGQVFIKCISDICDVQAMTGLAILTSGFISLRCALSAYHWRFIVQLAWFSAVVHSSGLTILRDHLSPRTRAPKVAVMAVLHVMLVVALVPTGYFGWGGNYPGSGADMPRQAEAQMASAAVCYFQRGSGVFGYWVEQGSDNMGGQFSTMVVSVVLLVVGFVTRMVKLFPELSSLLNTRLRGSLSGVLQKLLRNVVLFRAKDGRPGTAWFKLVGQPCLALFLALRVSADQVTSVFGEIYWLLVVIAWGTVNLMLARADQPERIRDEESQWTFGQILPIMLLLAPLYSTLTLMLTPDDQSSVTSATELAPSKPETHTRELDSSAETHLLPRTINTDSLPSTSHPASKPNHDEIAYPLHFHDSALQRLIADNYAPKPEWLGPHFTGSSAGILFLTAFTFCLIFIFAELTAGSVLFEFAIIWQILFGYPACCAITVLIGLELDAWLARSAGGGRKGRSLRFKKVLLGVFCVGVQLAWVLGGYQLHFLLRGMIFAGGFNQDLSVLVTLVVELMTVVIMYGVFYGLYLCLCAIRMVRRRLRR